MYSVYLSNLVMGFGADTVNSRNDLHIKAAGKVDALGAVPHLELNSSL